MRGFVTSPASGKPVSACSCASLRAIDRSAGTTPAGDVRTHAAATGPSTSVAEQLGVTKENVGAAVSPEEFARYNNMWQSCPIERAYVVPQSDITVRLTTPHHVS